MRFSITILVPFAWSVSSTVVRSWWITILEIISAQSRKPGSIAIEFVGLLSGSARVVEPRRSGRMFST
jgi:hypothetical protein